MFMSKFNMLVKGPQLAAQAALVARFFLQCGSYRCHTIPRFIVPKAEQFEQGFRQMGPPWSAKLVWQPNLSHFTQIE